MAATTKPTVIFVHGSWHVPAHYARVRTVFEKAGYPTVCPQQPNIGAKPPVGLKEDAACLRAEVEKLVEQDEKDVIVVAHSYGGNVTTEAVEEKLGKRTREAKGQKGGVINLVYMCAFMLKIGKSIVDAFGTWPPFIPVDDDGTCLMDDPAGRFYHDLPPDEQQHWVSLLMRCPAMPTTGGAVSHLAYLYHPVTYLFCENDRALPFSVQKMMVESAKEAGVEIKEETCEASHSPFLSMPERVLEVVKGIA